MAFLHFVRAVSPKPADSAGVFVRLRGHSPYRMMMPVAYAMTAAGVLGGAAAADDLNEQLGTDFDQVVWALLFAVAMSAAYQVYRGRY